MAWDLPIYAPEFEQTTAGSPELKYRNNHLVLAYDAAAIESATYTFVLPAAYASGSNLNVSVYGYGTTGTSGNVRVRLEFERVTGQDIDSDGFATAQEANAAANATSGVLFAATFALSNANIDGPSAGDLMRVKVSRVGSDATNDTMTGDWEFSHLVISQ